MHYSGHLKTDLTTQLSKKFHASVAQNGVFWGLLLKPFKTEDAEALFFFFSLGGRNFISLFFIHFVVLSVNSDFKVNVFHKTANDLFIPRSCKHFFRLYFFLIDLLSSKSLFSFLLPFFWNSEKAIWTDFSLL